MSEKIVGDLKSQEKGTGARFNDGKVPYDVLPLSLLLLWMRLHTFVDGGYSPQAVLEHLGAWQAGDDAGLDRAIDTTLFAHELQAFAPAARVFKYVTERPVKPYPMWNWLKGMPWSVPLGCALRHTLAQIEGEKNDPDTGLTHLGHLQCNLIMLLVYRHTFVEGDDRPKKWLAEIDVPTLTDVLGPAPVTLRPRGVPPAGYKPVVYALTEDAAYRAAGKVVEVHADGTKVVYHVPNERPSVGVDSSDDGDIMVSTRGISHE